MSMVRLPVCETIKWNQLPHQFAREGLILGTFHELIMRLQLTLML